MKKDAPVQQGLWNIADRLLFVLEAHKEYA
jgi:hypothetical protein